MILLNLIYNDFWEKVDLGSKRYDFILCSHVLYYIEEGHWLNGQRILEDMVTIVFFLLIDRRFREYEEKIRQYFESHHKRANGYRMMQDEILLVILCPSKNGTKLLYNPFTL